MTGRQFPPPCRSVKYISGKNSLIQSIPRTVLRSSSSLSCSGRISICIQSADRLWLVEAKEVAPSKYRICPILSSEIQVSSRINTTVFAGNAVPIYLSVSATTLLKRNSVLALGVCFGWRKMRYLTVPLLPTSNCPTVSIIPSVPMTSMSSSSARSQRSPKNNRAVITIPTPNNHLNAEINWLVVCRKSLRLQWTKFVF